MREVNPGNVLGVQGCLHLNGLSPRSSTTKTSSHAPPRLPQRAVSKQRPRSTLWGQTRAYRTLNSMRRANCGRGWGLNQLPVKNNLNRNSPLGQRTGQAARPQMPPGEHVNSGTPRPHHCRCHHPVTREKGDGLGATPWAGRLLLTLSVILLLTPRSISMLSHSVTPMA